jgi:hypothetical protein
MQLPRPNIWPTGSAARRMFFASSGACGRSNTNPSPCTRDHAAKTPCLCPTSYLLYTVAPQICNRFLTGRRRRAWVFAATCLNAFQTNYTVLRHTSSPADAGGTITSFVRALCMPESGAEEACMWMLTDTTADHDCQKRSAGGVPQGKRTTRKPRGRESRSVTLTTHKLLITGYIQPNHHFHLSVFQKEFLWMWYIVLCINVSTRIRNTK